MSSYKELLAQRERLDKQIHEVKKAEFAAVIQAVKKQIEEYGITADDLGFKGGKGRKTRQQGSISPKYQDPASGAKWSGRGKAPKWIADRPREQFLIRH